MARRRSLLLDFLRRGLDENKYQNLRFINGTRLIFSIDFPHRRRKSSVECEDILKDWYRLRNMEYVLGSKDYTKGKLMLLACLRKSDDVEVMRRDGGKITCRILSEEERREKRSMRREFRERRTQNTDEAIPSFEPRYIMEL